MLNQNPAQPTRDLIGQQLIAAGCTVPKLNYNMIKDYMAASLHVHREDFELDLLGTRKNWVNVADAIINEQNDIPVA